MNWRINGVDYPVLRLAALLGLGSGALAVALAILFKADAGYTILIGVVGGLGGALALMVVFLADLALNAKAEGEMRRAKLRAAQKVYQSWADGKLEPPDNLQTAVYRVGGEERKLEWINDDDPNTGKWRWMLVELFCYARAIHRETAGKRTGLTEVDLVGEGAQFMFAGREQYLSAINVAKELGLVERVNGLPTRLAQGWTFLKVITYLQKAAVIAPIKNAVPSHRHYKGVA